MITNYYRSIVLHGKVEIDKCVFSNFGMFSIMECNWPLQKRSLSDFAQHFIQNFPSFLFFVLMQIIKINIKIVGF
ncbi:hypothetical protein ASJ35_17990 [Ruthenibacterium lactatiformans]|uniref:Uncharacterized protein n=1 Tax=Ruthenibacterium lactatiformans TaxID=1550024 RepID=A0A0W7TLD2_9FIRM|nr:hypothetical protein ASJ35_17990 [Ruthenibacterium lactatiformans]